LTAGAFKYPSKFRKIRFAY